VVHDTSKRGICENIENQKKRFFFQGSVPLDVVQAVFHVASSAQKRRHGE
jgi:hypothetical protein